MALTDRRDLFAAAALQGLLAGRNPEAKAWSTLEVARVAVECADYVISVTGHGNEPMPPPPDNTPVPGPLVTEPTLPAEAEDADSTYISLVK